VIVSVLLRTISVFVRRRSTVTMLVFARDEHWVGKERVERGRRLSTSFVRIHGRRSRSEVMQRCTGLEWS
jgi:hypothetical protein